MSTIRYRRSEKKAGKKVPNRVKKIGKRRVKFFCLKVRKRAEKGNERIISFPPFLLRFSNT